MDTEQIHTFCRICEPGCGILATVQGDEILRLQPDKSHPVHKGFSCHKGVHYLQLHNDPDRLDRPLKRINPRSEKQGIFVPVSWDEAVAEIAARLKEIQARSGDGAISYYQGNPSAFSGAYYANVGALKHGLGIGAHFGSGTQDMMCKFTASEAIYGTLLAHPIPDLLHTDYFLCFGSNPLVSHMSLIHISDPMEKLKAINRRGGKVLFINPRKIESSIPETGPVLQIKPDTDIYFLAAMLHEIIFNIGYDRAFVEQHARNTDALEEYVRQWPAERVASVCGVEPETIRTIARDFCAAEKASINMSTGVNQGRQGTLAYWLLNMISLFSGNLGKRGGNIYSRGVADVVQAGKRTLEDPFFEGPFGQTRLAAGELPAVLLPEYIENPEAPIRAMIVVSGNPLLTVGGEARMRKAFETLELIVCLDIYRNVTGEMADFILPATDWLEREDVNFLGTMGVAMEPYVQYTPAVVPPKADRRDDWWILSRIIQEMGGPSLLDDAQPNAFSGIDAMMAPAGLSIEALKAMPCQTAILPDAVPSHVFSIAVQNDDGLIDCFPTVFARGFPAVEANFAELKAEDPDQLKLITRRTNTMVNSWLHNLPVFKHGVHLTNPLWMCTADANSRGLVQGAAVSVSNQYGTVEAILLHDDTLRPGVVAMTHGWGQQRASSLNNARSNPGVNSNILAPMGKNAFDPLSNQSHITGFNVDVVRISPAQADGEFARRSAYDAFADRAGDKLDTAVMDMSHGD